FDLAEPSRAKKVLRGHIAQVFALVFSPNGARLYSGSFDGTVLVWDVMPQAPGLSSAHKLIFGP
ncbi:MAG: cytochrome C, partial [Clostridia bacterium]|nr:cytochrome C [Clostridia bacterium]